MGISWQSLESPDMKRSLGMPTDATGVYIINTEPLYHASKVQYDVCTVASRRTQDGLIPRQTAVI